VRIVGGVYEAAARQLRLLGEIADALGARGVPFWLRGGWALEFLLGRVTRDHADVDLVAWRSDRDAIVEELTARGFVAERELPEVAVDFAKDGESVQVLLVETSAAGALVCRGFESWPFPDGALEGPLCRNDAVSCRTLALHALLYEKETYELHRGRPPRAKDHESIRLLRELAQAQPKRPVT
jgi:Aminoglycoside-2''-adenylyltransferase